ncbi:D-alanyl-D-alanine carboxypeptidase/D-alanyl-D-alanine-endopeptidase (penicillin-binding protein 4) [Mucilaginibacter gracilis]|uniref:D-alanyl-D-alanine carboxypeptidase/D-alanyl-D-alanine-endopeptidase (Penicillin-binding protein 4) n=1 Tax=Mucilaginibacter gracilis TaxID=423350 RepID=A0A495JAM8_9SPHI|nr:D-alanyl-D-alanine carboxypeptidase/D-alanyl-D-alanine-endopeptidase [Mucilaginibacter gracilis]RKR85412.1 D-alanyl-D-alanine carboxypeptidase/D-alanyl-D-alanine-endopeptidase (penicillin-binding protein 4) [Mucilaginibacter gracilis]
MMKKLLTLSLFLVSGFGYAQGLQQRLQLAFNRLQQDSQSRYASISLTVLDAKTGEQVFAVNPNMGLATASTLKTITSITAFNILGKDYQYTTSLLYNGNIDADGTLTGDIVIRGSGDPTLGSWRYPTATVSSVLNLWVDAIRKAGIKRIKGRIVGDDSAFGTQTIPEGWIWQDIGNYYGAGTSGLCWRENQFDIKLRTGRLGTPIGVAATVPTVPYLYFKSELLNAEAGTGDKSYAYLPIQGSVMYLRGTYAADQTKKSIAVALPDPAFDAAFRLADTLKALGIDVSQSASSIKTITEKNQTLPVGGTLLVDYHSPKLSQIIYWLNQKSINLYAEQLLKTLALASGKKVSTDAGVQVEQAFWKARGIDPRSLNIVDGSGLSPGDRVTTLTLATILQSAKGHDWFPDFYNSLPVYNDMKMKSGSINNVLTYAGYQTTKTGREVCFSIMVNNFSGSTSGIKQKMFEVLNELK